MPVAKPSGVQTLLVAAILTVATSSQGLLTTASKTHDGKYAYNFATVPLLAETLKLVVSAALLWQRRATARITLDVKSVAMFPVPSIIYLVHNNVQFVFLSYVDPSTYQILGNLKILTTGVLLRVLLGRKLTPLQWIALGLLTAGAATSQLSGCAANGGSSLSAPALGYFWGIVSAFLSGFAAAYTEFVMKRNSDDLYWQNCQLYAFGTVFNLMRLAYDGVTETTPRLSEDGQPLHWLFDMLHGYSLTTWLVVSNLAFTGLLVSWIMKFADSIVKVYATSMAMLVTMLASVAFFGLSPTPQLFLGIVIASASLQIYYLKPEGAVPSGSSGKLATDEK
ncbi:hypothetical protein PPROV_000302600 [Pycnococcus provasolii]|uniref:Uncharacterized protein n=1 Tax=Pycnococcus provasolii TaxID=41880 RepID=A0A830HC83_9CHLO|nr:hypothetical protein PPROV_000302600 [Pycnococcus provasolii]